MACQVRNLPLILSTQANFYGQIIKHGPYSDFALEIEKVKYASLESLIPLCEVRILLEPYILIILDLLPLLSCHIFYQMNCFCNFQVT